MKMSISLVLADDHPIVLDGLENLFRQEPDLRVLARCGSAEETLQAVRQHRPDVLLLDLQMPGLGGLALLRQMKNENLPTRVVLLAATLEEDQLLDLIRLGVPGVVLKEMAPHMFVQCIRKVHAGGQWLERKYFRRAMEKLLRREAGTREAGGILTPREIEVVRMVTGELSNKQIAEKLFISEGTVKCHLHHVFEKLRVSNRDELTSYAQTRGLIPSAPRAHSEAGSE
jgi:DNA-binding NarL/FixJ family response regulator